MSDSSTKVADILAGKDPTITTIRPTETVAALSQLLRQRRIGAAIVSRDGQAIEGVISERDIAYGLAKHNAGLHALPVSALMTKAVITCTPDDSIATVASTMLARNIRHLPVEKDNRLVGMISMRDVLNSRLQELQHQTSMLRAFVSETVRDPQDR
jgi:CBS domain-containing protein